MSKYNLVANNSTKTVNLAGGAAYKETPALALVSLVLTSFMEDKFYESSNSQLERLKQLIAVVDKDFVGKLAVYARKEFHMRSVSHVLIAELVRIHKGQKKYVEAVIERPDDMLEILAYTISKYKKPIPNSLKKGLASALKKFNVYKLGKYQGKTKEISLCDLINLIHPKGTKEQMALWGSVLKGTLPTPDTWEVKISGAGSESGRKEEWERLISEDKMGYMAILRNLRNLEDYNVSEVIKLKVFNKLTDTAEVKASKQLPFRFYQAYVNTKSAIFKDACAIAMNKALSNVPEMSGKTLVCVDTSGSMDSQLSNKGDTKYIDMAALFGAVTFKANPYNVEIIGFDTDARNINPSSQSSVFDIMPLMQAAGGATNLWRVFEKIDQENRIYDRIIIFSDMQAWDSYDSHSVQAAFQTYKRHKNINPKIYSVDLAGHGTLQFPERNVYCLAGWSEKIFDMMAMLEQDKHILIDTINNYQI